MTLIQKSIVLSSLAGLICHSSNAYTFSPLFKKQRAASSTTITGLSMANNSSSEAQKLLEQAAKIRAQLAELEGKSVTEVENEAREKKESKERRLEEQAREREEKEAAKAKDGRNSYNRVKNQVLYVPNNAEEQTRQAAYAVERAFQDGITRQTVRLALVKEGKPITGEDEELWPGGAEEMYREAGRPLTEELLKEIRVTAKSLQTEEEKTSGKEHYPPTVKAQDIWDFDGSALITAEAASGPSSDVQAMVFPNTDTKYLKDAKKISEAMGKERLFLLVNPFWRNVDSWGFNILAPNAKKMAQEVIYDCEGGGFEETYVLSRFSVRGEDCVALKAYPFDWQVFAYIQEDNYGIPVETAIRLGSFKEYPKSSQITELLNERPEFKLTKTMRKMNDMF